MGIWSSIASAAKNQAVRKVGRFVTYPIVHPGRTLQGAGAATKTPDFDTFCSLINLHADNQLLSK